MSEQMRYITMISTQWLEIYQMSLAVYQSLENTRTIYARTAVLRNVLKDVATLMSVEEADEYLKAHKKSFTRNIITDENQSDRDPRPSKNTRQVRDPHPRQL